MINEECVTCSRCGTRVSQYVTVTGEPAQPLIVRAWVECPECIEKHAEDICEGCRLINEQSKRHLK